MFQRKFRLTILLSIVLILLAACSAKSSPEATPNQATSPANNAKTDEPSAPPASTYPLQTDATLTYWLQSPITLRPSVSEVPFYQEWARRIGVPIRYVEVSPAQATETFSVMLSSGNLPDIIEYNWLNGVTGGPEKALKDGYILRLNELIAQYAPNLQAYLAEHPDLDRLVKTDNGDYYVFPFLKEGGMTTQWAGPVIRKDWLEQLQLELPTTIEQWRNMLTAFKTHGYATTPLTFSSQPHALQGFLDGAFIGAFGVIRDFYMASDGTVQYGPLETGYRDFLAEMQLWYKEGLLDPNFAQNDRKTQDAHMLNGTAGATVSSGANIDKWEAALAADNPEAGFIFAPYPVLNQGETPKFGQEAWLYGAEGSAAISASSAHPELAVQVLDYAYSEEGYRFFNYGTEGESYTLAGDAPVLTPLITDNPDKLSYLEALTLYTHTVKPGPYVGSKDLIGNLAITNDDHDYTRWKTDNLLHVLPPVSIAAADASEYARIMTDVHTLVDEWTLKAIMGVAPVDEAYDEIVQTLESLHIQRAIAITQAAYDRYLNR